MTLQKSFLFSVQKYSFKKLIMNIAHDNIKILKTISIDKNSVHLSKLHIFLFFLGELLSSLIFAVILTQVVDLFVHDVQALQSVDHL